MPASLLPPLNLSAPVLKPAAASPKQPQSDGDSFRSALDRATTRSDKTGNPDDAPAANAPKTDGAVLQPGAKSKTAEKKGSDDTDPRATDVAAKAKTDQKSGTDGQVTSDSDPKSHDEHPDDPDHPKVAKKSDTAVAAQAPLPTDIVQIRSDAAPPKDATPSPKTDKSPLVDATAIPVALPTSPVEDPASAKAIPAGKAAAVKNAADASQAAVNSDVQQQSPQESQPQQAVAAATTSAAPAANDSSPDRLAIQPKQSHEGGDHATDGSPIAAATAAASVNAITDPTSGDNNGVPTDAAAPVSKSASRDVDDALSQIVSPTVPQPLQTPETTALKPASDGTTLPQPQEAQFAQANHPQIVSEIRGQLLPNGGTMRLQLDPPELGALSVRVHMRDGVMTASFETSNDDTAKLLSHSLGDLKSALEAQGVSVEKLHVSQSPKQQSSGGDDHRSDRETTRDSAARQEQQRRDMTRRMWRKLMKTGDPLDMVA